MTSWIPEKSMRAKLSRKEIIYFALLIIGVFHLVFSINYFRLFHIDDPWVASLYYEQFQTGAYLSPTVHDNMSLTFSSFIMRNTYGLVMNIFADVIHIHRVLSTIVSFYVLLMVYLIALEVSENKLVALKSIVFLTFIEYFVQAAHMSRPDIMVSAFVLTSFLLLLKFNSRTGYFFAGLAGGLAVDVHLIGILSLFMLVGWEIASGRFNKSRVLMYVMLAAGYLLSAGLWVFTHLRYFGPMVESWRIAEREAVSTSVINRVLWLVNIGLESKYYRDFLYLAVLGATLALAFTIKLKAMQRALIFTFLTCLVGFLLLGRLSRFYIVAFFPLLFIAFAWITEKKKTYQLIFGVAVLYLCVFWGAVYARDGQANFEPYADSVYTAARPYLQEESIVIGPINLWYVFKEYEFHAYRSRADLGGIIRENPSVILISNEVLSRWLESDQDISPESEVTRFRKDELEAFKEVGLVKDKHYGSYGLLKGNVTTVFNKDSKPSGG